MRSGRRLSRAATRKFRNVLNGAQLHYYNQIGKPRALAGGLAKFDSSGNRRVPGVGVCFVPPHPSPLPKERESAGTALENSHVAVADRASLSVVSETQPRGSVVLSRHGRVFLPLLGASGRGLGWNRTPAVLAASALESVPKNARRARRFWAIHHFKPPALPAHFAPAQKRLPVPRRKICPRLMDGDAKHFSPISFRATRLNAAPGLTICVTPSSFRK